MAEVELRRLMDEASGHRADSSVQQGCDEWLRYLEHERRLAERTLTSNRDALCARLTPFFGADTQLSDITTQRIDAFRAHALTVGGARGRPLKPSTVQRDLTLLSGILRRALRLRWIDSNPYEDAERVKCRCERRLQRPVRGRA